MIEFIFLKIPGVKYFLSEKLCQDPLESFFGNQRMHGGSNDNPNVATFVQEQFPFMHKVLHLCEETLQQCIILNLLLMRHLRTSAQEGSDFNNSQHGYLVPFMICRLVCMMLQSL